MSIPEPLVLNNLGWVLCPGSAPDGVLNHE